VVRHGCRWRRWDAAFLHGLRGRPELGLLSSLIWRSMLPPPQSRCAPPTWQGRVVRRKEAAAAAAAAGRVLGAAQDAGAGTRRGGWELREDVVAARVWGATQTPMWERGEERKERGIGRLGAGCSARWERWFLQNCKV